MHGALFLSDKSIFRLEFQSILLFESLGVLWMVEQTIHVDASSKDAINLHAMYLGRQNAT